MQGAKQYYIQLGKATFATYAVMGAVWWWNKTHPEGWWSSETDSKEQRETKNISQREEHPHPGGEEAPKNLVEDGGTRRTTLGTQKVTKKREYDIPPDQQREKLETRSYKLWLEMRREVLEEFEIQGYDSKSRTGRENGVERSK